MNEQNTSKGKLRRRVVTTESFIAEVEEIYGDRYNYSKVDMCLHIICSYE